MMKKLRVFLAAALLVPALFSNANAFTTDDSIVSTERPGWCFIYWNGALYYYPC
jgi:hypothetical protein